MTLIRLIGKEVEHLDNPEAALDSLLYQASRLLNDFSDDGTPRAIEETPSPDRQSRERLDSRCFDSSASSGNGACAASRGAFPLSDAIDRATRRWATARRRVGA